MAYGTPQKIVTMLVLEMGFEEAQTYLHNLPPEVKAPVMAELSTAASFISKIDRKFYSERGVPLALHADID